MFSVSMARRRRISLVRIPKAGFVGLDMNAEAIAEVRWQSLDGTGRSCMLDPRTGPSVSPRQAKKSLNRSTEETDGRASRLRDGWIRLVRL